MVVGMIESGPELSFLERHKLVAYLVVAWAVGIITAIVWVWLANFGKAGMPDATMGGSVVALFGVALLNLRKVRGLE